MTSFVDTAIEYWWVFVGIVIVMVLVAWINGEYFNDDEDLDFTPDQKSEKVDDNTELFVFPFTALKDLTNVTIHFEYSSPEWEHNHTDSEVLGNFTKDKNEDIDVEVDIKENGERAKTLYIQVNLTYDEGGWGEEFEYLSDSILSGRYNLQD